MLILAFLFLTGVLMGLRAIAVAPFGYQDEDGFHAGIPRARKPGNRGASPS